MYEIWLIGVLFVVIIIWLYSRTIESFSGDPLPRVRRNMSYDLRGDIPIPFRPVSPWNNPEVGPIHNPQIFMQM
jgi:hypothetical protein